MQNWGAGTKMQKGHRINRQTESWGQMFWVLRWRGTVASLLLFSIILVIYSASFLCLYSLKPYSFTVL
jgi:hypothetical protein